MGVEHVEQKSRLEVAEKENTFSFDTSTLCRDSGQRTCVVYRQPVTCLQDQQWQMGAGRGSCDSCIWALNVFALHRQREVSVTVESLTEAIAGARIKIESKAMIHSLHNRPLLLKETRALRVLGQRELIG